ncbi:15066_t:CDS:2, partial [Racocetra persica]
MNSNPLIISNNINAQKGCSGCDKLLSLSSFITNQKTFSTCNTCRGQNKVIKQQKKIQNQDEKPDSESIIELGDFDEHLMQIFDSYKCRNDNQENNNPSQFEFSCTVNISTLEGNSKEQADYIIDVISKIDDYMWIYHNKYSSKKSKSITYTYYCSQRDCLAEKPKKHNDINKHRNRQQMERFSCKGCIKIIISQDLTFSTIEMYHSLHILRLDNSISPEIKQFILSNIDLLPREIYKRLVAQSLNINIYQKQIHYWWTEIGKERFKRDDDSFFSAQKWLREKSHQIILQRDIPLAIGFLTTLWNTIRSSNFQIDEIGVDAT